MLFRLLCAFAIAVISTGPAGDAWAGEPGTWQWKRIDVDSIAAVGSAALTALAVDPPSGRVALGHTHGVAIGLGSGGAGRAAGLRSWRFTSAARLTAVTDLHFARDGALWIATLDGLWRLDSSGELRDRSPAPGDAAHRVRRVRSADALLAAGTDAGVYLSRDGEIWQALNGDMPSGGVVALALEVGAADPDVEAQLWLGEGGELWHVEIRARGERLQFTNRRLGRAPGVAPAALLADLTLDISGVGVTLVHPQTLVFFEPLALERWKVLRPVLPPGSAASRILETGGSLWLGTDRGLLRAEGLAGPWRRNAALPVGARVHALAESHATSPDGSDEVGLWVLADRALYLGSLVQQSSAPTVESGADAPVLALHESGLLAREPSIEEVHEAALRHVGLTTEMGRRLRDGLWRRAWLPRLSVGGGYADDRDRSDDYDESFVSGDTRHLHDREFDRARGWHVSLAASWDLATLLYDPEAIDFSREERQVIALRDDVLDEINQIYFERLGLLLVIETATGVEANQARLRAQELAAGLDGWTGGWFSGRLRAASPAGP